MRGPVSRAPARDAGEVGAIPTHLTTFARGDEGVESALCRREVSRCESDHERHFGRVVQQPGPLSYTEEITVRIRACPPLSGSSTVERPSVKRQDVGANPTLTAIFVGE